jgi:cation transport regulator ChaB
MPTKATPGKADALQVPATILRSEKHAQDIWRKAHDSAIETYGEAGRAHRVAYAALKHQYEKRGDKWIKKTHAGPSDPQAARGPDTWPKSTDIPPAPTAGGKVAGNEEEALEKAQQARREYAQTRKKQPEKRS